MASAQVHTMGNFDMTLVGAGVTVYAPVTLESSMNEYLNFGKVVVLDRHKSVTIGVDSKGGFSKETRNAVPFWGHDSHPAVAHIHGTKDRALPVHFDYNTWMEKGNLTIQSPKALANFWGTDHFDIPLYGKLEVPAHQLGNIQGLVLVTAHYL
jgi:hypothetical protein